MRTLLTFLASLAIPASAAVLSYQYDAAGRLAGVNYGGVSNTTYTYDKNGSLLTRINAANPLPPLAANYGGLVENAAPSVANTGAISIKLLPTGAYTGKLVIAGASFSIKGTFAPNGTTPDITLSRKAPMAALTLHLVLDVAGGTNQITGTVSDGTFTSELVMHRAAYDKKLNPLPSGLTGAYTVLFLPTQAGANVPQGHGYGTVKVDSAGAVKVAAALADGTRITQSATLGSAGTWPLYLSLYKGGGQLAGVITFGSDPGTSDFAGELDWRKPATALVLYPGAFVTPVEMIGSKYQVPPKGQRVLDLASVPNNARVTASATGVTPLDKLVTLDAANRFLIPADATKLKLTLSTPTGLFLGSYVGGTGTHKFGGVVFQEQGIGSGFVTGPAETGPAVIAEP